MTVFSPICVGFFIFDILNSFDLVYFSFEKLTLIFTLFEFLTDQTSEQWKAFSS